MAGAGIATCRVSGPLIKPLRVKSTTSGFRIGELIIRCDNGWTNRAGEKTSKIEPIAVKLFGGTLKHVEDMQLGIADYVDVSGSISGREWKDRYFTEIIGDKIVLVDRGTGFGTGTTEFPDVNLPDMPDMSKPMPKKDDDLPF